MREPQNWVFIVWEQSNMSIHKLFTIQKRVQWMEIVSLIVIASLDILYVLYHI